ncbi:MAG: hypothetical protein JWQ96_2143 [Segetibacter sp.]|nr:hypothetical protein [Segetibacter sp.]
MKVTALLILLFISVSASAQKGDMVLIKKGNKTIKLLMPGSLAVFQTVDGNWYNSRIEQVANDSIFFKEVIVRQVPTPWGVSKLDTMTTYLRGISYKDITAIPRHKNSFGFIRNGTLFILAGGGYIVLNLINAAYLKYPPFGNDNLPGLLTATGIFATGYVLNKLHKPYLKIEKKYRVEYVPMRTR